MLAVHHRVAGNGHPALMITLCLAHHAMVTRSQILLKDWPELLRVLWREQHPEAPEQCIFGFDRVADPAASHAHRGLPGFRGPSCWIETQQGNK